MLQKQYVLELPPGLPKKERAAKLAETVAAIKDLPEFAAARTVFLHLACYGLTSWQAEAIATRLHDALPAAQVAGMSINATPDPHAVPCVALNAMLLRDSSVTLLASPRSTPEELSAEGERLGRALAAIKNLRAVLVYGAGVGLQLTKFLEKLGADVPDVPLVGAVAGINFRDKQPRLLPDAAEQPQEAAENACLVQSIFDFVGSDVTHALQNIPAEQPVELRNIMRSLSSDQFVIAGHAQTSGVVLAAFSGANLHAESQFLRGWRTVGKKMTVKKTSHSGYCVEQIDEMPAAELHQRYLGVVPDQKYFLYNVCEFPLYVRRGDVLLGRVPMFYDRAQRLYFNCDLREGDEIQLSYGNAQEVLRDTWQQSEKMRAFAPEACFLSICANRTGFLQQNAQKEWRDYRRLTPGQIELFGECEIYQKGESGGVTDNSIAVLGLREGAPREIEPCAAPAHCSGTEEEVIPLATRLAKFLEVTTDELADAAQKAKEASRAKSLFLSNMSHEIRTPINGVLGMNEMILREAKEENILAYARDIQSAGQSLLSLVNDILDFSKIEAGKMEILPVDFSPSSSMNDLMNMVEKRAHDKGLAFDIEADTRIPSVLRGDEIRIKQVITNILTNAVKYTEEGSVTLKVGLLGQSDGKATIRVAVEDTGIGIKQEDLPKLFSAFERIEERRNRTIEGTGLGMNITQRLLALMGSKLEVESVYGKGSTFSFTLTLPVVNPEPIGDYEDAYRRFVAGAKRDHEQFTAPEAKILIVDDTKMNLAVATNLLRRTKVQTVTAESGLACLARAREEKFDVILLDHRMPEMDGIETLARLKKDETTKNKETPVIALTANAVSGARESYLAAGFDDYLTKPINSALLEKMLMKYLPSEKIHRVTDEEAAKAEQNAAAETTGGANALPDWLANVSCLDTAQGIKNCGSAKDYLAALKIFAESIEDGADEIERYQQDGDCANYTTKVHALKSTARIIGASELSEKARRLEDAGNSRYLDEIERDTPALLALYRGYRERLAPLLAPEKTDEEKPPIPEENFAEAVAAMREFAAMFDDDELRSVLDSLTDYALTPEQENLTERIKKDLARLDWEAVQNDLQDFS